MNEAQWRWLREVLGIEIPAPALVGTADLAWRESAQDLAHDAAQDVAGPDTTPRQRAADGGRALPIGQAARPSVSARVIHSEPGYVNSEGDWLAATSSGIVPQGPILATDFVLVGLPPLLQSKFGPIRYGHDSAAQGFLIVPTDANGATLTLSPPSGYDMPTLDALQAGAYWQGVVTGATQDLPELAREALHTAEDLQTLSRGGLLLDGPQSRIGQQIQDGSFSLDRTMGSVVVNSPLGWLTDVAAGTSNSLRRAGATSVVNAASALAPAGVAAVFGRMARLDARVTDASLLAEVRGGQVLKHQAGPNASSRGNTESVTAAPAVDKSYGVAFFGDGNLSYYTRDSATVGRQGKSFFMMPLEDSAVVKDASDAALHTGRAPSAESAYLAGGDIYGLSFPTEGMGLKRPTGADAGGWPHFLEGGNTAVRLGHGPDAGYLVNPTREFVIPGGNKVPSGSVLFQLGPHGEWIAMRRF